MSVAVNVGACTCPGAPHADGDVVYLRDKLGFTGGSVLQGEMSEYLSTPREERGGWVKLNARLKALYLEEGIEDWNLLDDKRQPIPVTLGTIRSQFLDDFAKSEQVIAIADKADDLYYDSVLAPLVKRLLGSSQPTPTNGSTSQTPSTDPQKSESPSTAPSRKPRKRSKPSSTSTSLTGVTVMTSQSPAGVSSSSPS